MQFRIGLVLCSRSQELGCLHGMISYPPGRLAFLGLKWSLSGITAPYSFERYQPRTDQGFVFWHES